MNLGKSLTDLAFAPARVGLAVADAGLGVASGALGMAHRSLGESRDGVRQPPTSFASMLGVEDAVDRANRLARLMDEDQPLGRALAPGRPDRPAAAARRRGGSADRAGRRARPADRRRTAG